MAVVNGLAKVNQHDLKALLVFWRDLLWVVEQEPDRAYQDVVLAQIAMHQPRLAVQLLSSLHGLLVQRRPLLAPLLDFDFADLRRGPAVLSQEAKEEHVVAVRQWLGHGHPSSLGADQVAKLLLGPHAKLLARACLGEVLPNISGIARHVLATVAKFLNALEHLDGNVVPAALDALDGVVHHRFLAFLHATVELFDQPVVDGLGDLQTHRAIQRTLSRLFCVLVGAAVSVRRNSLDRFLFDRLPECVECLVSNVDILQVQLEPMRIRLRLQFKIVLAPHVPVWTDDGVAVGPHPLRSSS
mmetsp:Transcript_22892/g.64850  ORF Transcript_22892/g.64850 Transcript_22892/m.64850 type:complete len:299 (+) Transcript_22892:377-1273(+)